MEFDLATLGVDYRDYWRPGHGSSQLTLRRLLLLVEGVRDRQSLFWAAVSETEPLSKTDILLGGIYESLERRPHPVMKQRELIEKRKQREKKKLLIKQARRQRMRMKRQLERKKKEL